jgi:phosphoglycolate phosphatase-like HAD superfamily hydrolase
MAELPSSLKEIELLILDMDGVITSEGAYWDVAGLVVRDILESPAYLRLSPPDYTPIADIFYQRLRRASRSDRRKYLPPELITSCKTRGINSNWDLAYLVVGLYIAPLFAPFSMFHQALFAELHDSKIDDAKEINGNDPNRNLLKDAFSPIWDRLQNKASNNEWHKYLRLQDLHLWSEWFRNRKCTIAPVNNIAMRIIDDFHPDVCGIKLLEELNKLLDDDAAGRIPIFGRKTVLWEECRDLFQQWYLGEELYQKTYGSTFAFTPKTGLIHNEEPLHGQPKTHAALSSLCDAGFKLGICTGRPRMEIITPLEKWDMLKYFETDRIVTHDDVDQAESELSNIGIKNNLGKPHPFPFMQSIRPGQSAEDIYQQCDAPLPDRNKILIVGDAMADIWAAKKIDCPCAALLSGALGESGRKDFEETKPDIICKDILELTGLLINR